MSNKPFIFPANLVIFLSIFQLLTHTFYISYVCGTNDTYESFSDSIIIIMN